MLAYLLRRLLWTVPTFLGITLLVFAAARALPGNAATIAAGGPESRESSVELEARSARYRAEYLLDQPLWKQYLHFLGPYDLSPAGHARFGGSGAHPWHGLLAFDFGREYGRPTVSVGDELLQRLEVTVPLALAAILLAYLVAIPIGVYTAARRGSIVERALTLSLFALHATPAFWLGLMAILLFGAAGLGWLPVVGLHGRDADALAPAAYARDTVLHAILPVSVLALPMLAYLSRQVRASMIEALESDYVRAARARGIPERAVVLRHALRNSLLPLITLASGVLPAAIGGSVVVETVFAIPGMGRYAYEGLLARDLNVILATTTVSAAVTFAALFLADVAYAVADPRIRHA
jgi:peptide/nickel transport system permease protein